MTEDKKGSRKVRLAVWSAKYLAMLGATLVFVYVVHGGTEAVKDYFQATYAYAYQELEKRFTRTVTVTEIVEPDKVSVEEIIDRVSSEYHVPAVIIKAMAVQESGHWNRTNAIREEPQLLGKRINPPKDLPDIERRMWVSSHGVLQVIYGFHYKYCGLTHFSQLYDPYTNIRCGVSILRKNWDSCSNIKNPGARLREALRMYNGSGEKAEAYAASVMAHLADLLTPEWEL